MTIISMTLVTLLDGLLAGMFVCSSMVEQAATALGATPWIAYKQAKEAVFGRVMPVAFSTGLLVTIGAALVLPNHLPLALASALMIGVFTITGVVHLPLNKLFGTWAPADYPVTWNEGRSRWRNWNLLRTGLMVAAYCLVLLAR